VSPIVGLLAPDFTLQPDPSEVAEVFEVPLALLMDPANHEVRELRWEDRVRRFYAMPYRRSGRSDQAPDSGHHFIWGATAGYLGGRIDELMMRFVDILYSLPFIFFVILLMVTFGRNIILIFLAIGAVEWLTMSRIVRGQTLSLKQKEFVEAARAAGLSDQAIITRHIVPNLLGPVVVYVTLTIPAVILAESFLSFLGMGVQEPLTSLGTLISQGAQDMEAAPWLLLFPSLTMVATLMCFNFIGDGLRDAIDPKDR
jgi:oligopeptide transport system permease protein